jgi:hypothetical protein
MKREIMVNVRMNPQEYQQLADVRKLMARTTGDAVRVLVRRAALEFGVTAQQNDRKPQEQAA